jgi:hypothetical protein
MQRPADHDACRGDPVREHHHQLVRRERIGQVAEVGLEVRMHVGESGDQELPGAVDTHRASRNRDRRPRADRRDSTVADDDGLIGEHSLPIHRNHRNTVIAMDWARRR